MQQSPSGPHRKIMSPGLYDIGCFFRVSAEEKAMSSAAETLKKHCLLIYADNIALAVHPDETDAGEQFPGYSYNGLLFFHDEA